LFDEGRSMSYQGKTVLVIGAARSGIAAARFLLAHGARVILTDTKKRDELEPAVTSLLDTRNSSG